MTAISTRLLTPSILGNKPETDIDRGAKFRVMILIVVDVKRDNTAHGKSAEEVDCPVVSRKCYHSPVAQNLTRCDNLVYL